MEKCSVNKNKTPEHDSSSLPSLQSTMPLQYLCDSIQLPSERHIISPIRHDDTLFPDGETRN